MTSPTQSAMEQQQREELRQILEFLYGADELDGCWYGFHPVGEPKYWWRSKLRAAIAKQDEELRSLRDSLALARSRIAELEGEQMLTDAYAEGRRDEQEELSSVLPGTTYMDPPDGGAPTILEQLQRQAKDAARYLWLRNHGLRYANVGLGSDCEGRNVVDFSPTFTIPEPAGMSYEDNEWSLTDLDAAIDAARAALNKEQP